MDRELFNLIYAFDGNGILLYILITTLTAGLLSFFIGLERQLRGKAAGVRTHALLSIGCSLLMTISVWVIRIADGSVEILPGGVVGTGGMLNYDTSRIASAVVTGIGFIGGGVIFKEKFDVRGLTTAGTLWVCSAIGLACGAGFVCEAAIVTAVTLFTLFLLDQVVYLIERRCPSVMVEVKAGYPIVERVRDLAERNGMIFKEARVLSCDGNGTKVNILFAYRTKPQTLQYLCGQIAADPDVLSAALTTKTQTAETK